MNDQVQPIIVKKIKKHGHGHHGGAWKVAYADFVTAMMAFFLLMWLMGNTTEGQRRAIADYFENPSPIEGSSGGSTSSILDMGGGSAMSKQTTPEVVDKADNPDDNQAQQSAQQIDEMMMKTQVERLEEIREEKEQEHLENLMSELDAAIKNNKVLQKYKDQLMLDITSEGLRIQVIDKQNRPMFDVGSANLKWYTKKIIHELDKFMESLPNKISIAGHTDTRVYNARAVYTNWELSADRANASRREMIAGGMPKDKIARVEGLASSVLFDKNDPLSASNRRISIVLLNKRAEEAIMGTSKRDINYFGQKQGLKTPEKRSRPSGITVKKKTTLNDRSKKQESQRQRDPARPDKIRLPSLPTLPAR